MAPATKAKKKPAAKKLVTPADAVYRRAAHGIFHDEGYCEIHEDAEVSRSDHGAYVAAWVFVKDSDSKHYENEEDCRA